MYDIYLYVRCIHIICIYVQHLFLSLYPVLWFSDLYAQSVYIYIYIHIYIEPLARFIAILAPHRNSKNQATPASPLREFNWLGAIDTMPTAWTHKNTFLECGGFMFGPTEWSDGAVWTRSGNQSKYEGAYLAQVVHNSGWHLRYKIVCSWCGLTPPDYEMQGVKIRPIWWHTEVMGRGPLDVCSFKISHNSGHIQSPAYIVSICLWFVDDRLTRWFFGTEQNGSKARRSDTHIFAWPDLNHSSMTLPGKQYNHTTWV